MFQLSVQDIHPGQQAGNKEEAIRQVAAALVKYKLDPSKPNPMSV